LNDARSPVPAQLRFTAPDGVRLAASAFGDPGGAPVLLLHGGGQTRHAWDATANALAARGAYAIALDLRGHGESGWSPDGRYQVDAFVEDVETVAASFASPPAIVGASLGGALALVVAARAVVALRAIVLVDMALRADDRGLERILAFMHGGREGFASLDEAADAVAAYLPHRERPTRLDGLKKNLRRRDDGRWYWHWDPALLHGLNIRQTRESGLLERAARKVTVPVLLVRGGQSDVVSEQIAREFLDAVPHARYVDVTGARHMVAGDENDAFTAAIVHFLSPAHGEADES
jgi:pimeloyl-ACP methyl ester carboxylesterase